MSQELTIQKSVSLFPTQAEWAMLKEQAAMAVRTGFLPKAVDTPEKAITIALKGRELGIPPMHAFSHIHIIQGKPTISAELMLSLIYKNCPGAVIDYVENSATKCVIRATRPGSQPATWAFSIEEAQKAGLLNKDSWKNYPGAMLRARAISIVARAVFPDAIMGCSYTHEELGAEVDDEGEVIEVPGETSPAPKALAAAPDPGRRDRKTIGDEIRKVAAAMNLNKAGVDDWIQDRFKKKREDLTNEEMEKFLAHLLEEAGRNGVAV